MAKTQTATPRRSIPVFDVELDQKRVRRARARRRLFLAPRTIVVVLGLFGVFGVRTATVSRTAGGYTLTVEYAAVGRPGLAAPLSIQVRHPGGFDDSVTVAMRSDYLAIFDENGMDPDPASSTADATWVYWEFDPPDGDVLAVDFDARIEPGVQWRRPGATRLLVGEVEVAAVTYTTWVMP